MERAFDTIVVRTRIRLDVPRLRTLFGVGQRPRRRGEDLSPRQAVVIEKPRWNLTLFKVHFGLLTLKGYTKGEHVLRFEAIVHNTRALRTGRVLDKFPAIVARLAGMTDHFTSMLDCVDVGFLPDGILDQLPTPTQIGATRVGGIDLNRTRMRNTLNAVLALAAAPDGFTVADLAAKIRAQTGATEHEYTTRQAAYDLRKLRGKHLVVKPNRPRRYHVPGEAASAIAALLTLRDKVSAPIRAGVRCCGDAATTEIYTRIDRDYETLRTGMRTLFTDLAIETAAGQEIVDHASQASSPSSCARRRPR